MAPIVCYDKKSSKNATIKRTDKIIQDVPFLKPTRAYRYKPLIKTLNMPKILILFNSLQIILRG